MDYLPQNPAILVSSINMLRAPKIIREDKLTELLSLLSYKN